MPSHRQLEMAAEAEQFLRGIASGRSFTNQAHGDDTRYELRTLRDFALRLLPAALLGEFGVRKVTTVAKDYRVKPDVVRLLMRQQDELDTLNWVSEVIARTQARDIARALERLGRPSVDVWVRTQPTTPLATVRKTYRGDPAFGIDPAVDSGVVDSVFATYRASGHEESIAVGGIVKAIASDRERVERDPLYRTRLSPLHTLSLTRPTAAMFAHAGAVARVVREEIGDRAPHVFYQGRLEGPGEARWLLHSSHTVPLVAEPGYQQAAREALGDHTALIVEAESSHPRDAGLERSHQFVLPGGAALGSEAFRQRVGDGAWNALTDDWILDEERDVLVVLVDAEFRPDPAERPGAAKGGERPTHGGQVLLVSVQDGPLRCFSVLNRLDGTRAWGSERERIAGLRRAAIAFGTLEGPGSTAGFMRRQQFAALERFNIPMSDPSGRENAWRIAAAVRQGELPPDQPVGRAPSSV